MTPKSKLPKRNLDLNGDYEFEILIKKTCMIRKTSNKSLKV